MGYWSGWAIAPAIGREPVHGPLLTAGSGPSAGGDDGGLGLRTATIGTRTCHGSARDQTGPALKGGADVADIEGIRTRGGFGGKGHGSKMRRKHRVSHSVVAGWLPLLLLLGSAAPVVARAPAFDLVVDGGRVMDSEPLLAADAGTVAQSGSRIPFRLMPEGAAIGVPVGLGPEWEPFYAATPRAGSSLLLPSEDSSGFHPSGDQWRLAADGLTPLSETPSEQRASQSPATSPDWPASGGIPRSSSDTRWSALPFSTRCRGISTGGRARTCRSTTGGTTSRGRPSG